MIIIDSDVVDIEIPKVISRTEALITEEGGRIASTDNWGRRKFACEINHKSEGTYVVWEIVTESAVCPTPSASRVSQTTSSATNCSVCPRSGPPWSPREAAPAGAG